MRGAILSTLKQKFSFLKANIITVLKIPSTTLLSSRYFPRPIVGLFSFRRKINPSSNFGENS